jgi:hypothetical protein
MECSAEATAAIEAAGNIEQMTIASLRKALLSAKR